MLRCIYKYCDIIAGDKEMSQDQYEVEKILERRVKDGSLEYKIKWKGYPMDQCTWEPIAHLLTVP